MSHIFGYGFFRVCSYRLDSSIGLAKSCCNGYLPIDNQLSSISVSLYENGVV
jgi:hypothetical protein